MKGNRPLLSLEKVFLYKQFKFTLLTNPMQIVAQVKLRRWLAVLRSWEPKCLPISMILSLTRSHGRDLPCHQIPLNP